MGLYDAEYLAANAFFLEANGQTVIYTPKLGDAVTCTAVVGAETVAWVEEQDRSVKRRETTVMLSADAAGAYGGVASPSLKAIVTIDGENWNIESIKPLGAAYVELVCVRLERDQRAAAVYRGK